MALEKVTYRDGLDVITADNLNDIQDEIIANASSISAETTARQSADTTLQTNLTNEITARQADTATRLSNSSLADGYSALSTYDVGDYCVYNNLLYRCITAITTTEAWTASHWTYCKIANEFGRYNVILSYDRTEEEYSINRTFSDLMSAYNAGKNIVVRYHFFDPDEGFEADLVYQLYYTNINAAAFSPMFSFYRFETEHCLEILNITASEIFEIESITLSKLGLSDIASEYSASSTYAVGDYCQYRGLLYRCRTAITTAEEFNYSHWTHTTAGAELKSKMTVSVSGNTLIIG